MSHFRRLSVRARGDEAEPLRARLLELVPAGLEELVDGDAVELAAYVPVEDVEALLVELPEPRWTRPGGLGGRLAELPPPGHRRAGSGSGRRGRSRPIRSARS